MITKGHITQLLMIVLILLPLVIGCLAQDKIQGTWNLVELKTDSELIKLSEDERELLRISLSKQSINGKNGCNSIFGSFSIQVDPDSSGNTGKIWFSRMTTTRVLCFPRVNLFWWLQDSCEFQIDKDERLILRCKGKSEKEGKLVFVRLQGTN